MKKKRERISLLRLPIWIPKRQKIIIDKRKKLTIDPEQVRGWIPCWIGTKKGRKFKWMPLASCITNSEKYTELHEDCFGCNDWIPHMYRLKKKRRKKIRKKILLPVRRSIL